MDCRTMMAPIKTSLFTDEPAAKAIDFMVEKHMGLVPVTARDGAFAGLISGDSLMRFMLSKTVSIMSRVERAMSHSSFFTFLKIGLPLMFLSVAIAHLYVWLRYFL